MLNTLIQYCNIMLDIQREGKEHLEKLKEMRYTCAFQSEVESGSLNNYFKEV